jgi:hypothetical protein
VGTLGISYHQFFCGSCSAKKDHEKMNVSRVDHNLQMYRQERIQLQDRREEDYRKVVEKRNVDRIIAERVARNIRLGLDKGRHIDVES